MLFERKISTVNFLGTEIPEPRFLMDFLGFEKHLGSLDVGKRADFVVVDLNEPGMQPIYDPIQAMVYSASRHNVRTTYVGGREIKTDPADILREFESIPKRLFED